MLESDPAVRLPPRALRSDMGFEIPLSKVVGTGVETAAPDKAIVNASLDAAHSHEQNGSGYRAAPGFGQAILQGRPEASRSAVQMAGFTIRTRCLLDACDAYVGACLMRPAVWPIP